MTYVLIANAPSRDFYEKVTDLVNLQGSPPQGLLVHTASETQEGVQVVDVWEFRDAAEDFERTRLFPAMESSGVLDTMTGPPPPSHELYPFDEWIRQSVRPARS